MLVFSKTHTAPPDDTLHTTVQVEIDSSKKFEFFNLFKNLVFVYQKNNLEMTLA